MKFLHILIPTKKKLIFSVFILTFLVIQITPSAGYWDPVNPDCIPQHGITLLNATYVPNAVITLDGKDDESAWNDPNVKNYLVPTATKNGSVISYKAYVYFKFIYDDTNLYVRALWNDTTLQNLQDCIYICWNINCTNFTVNTLVQPDVMRTFEPEAKVDNWKWPYADMGNQTAYKLIDQCYGPDGWYSTDLETQDVDSCASWGTWTGNSTYLLEMKRKLVTNDIYDVQFDHNGTYRFAIAVANDQSKQDHAVSWTYELAFDSIHYVPPATTTEEDDPSDTIAGYVEFVLIIGVTVVVSLKMRKITAKVQKI